MELHQIRCSFLLPSSFFLSFSLFFFPFSLPMTWPKKTAFPKVLLDPAGIQSWRMSRQRRLPVKISNSGQCLWSFSASSACAPPLWESSIRIFMNAPRIYSSSLKPRKFHPTYVITLPSHILLPFGIFLRVFSMPHTTLGARHPKMEGWVCFLSSWGWHSGRRE